MSVDEATLKKGFLLLYIIEAKDIHGKRWFRKANNAFCKVQMDKKTLFKTHVIEKTNDPKWTEKAQKFPLANYHENSVLKLTMYDYSSLSINEKIGEVSFKLGEVCDGVPRDSIETLKLKKKENGSIHLQLLFLKEGEEVTGNHEEFPYPLQTLMRLKRLDPFKKAVTMTDKEKPDANGLRPLHVACQLDLIDCVSYLIEKGADIKSLTPNDVQPVHYAAQCSHAALKLLLEKGAAKDALDKSQKQPMHYAAIGNNAQGIRLLLAAGAKVNIQDIEGQTPLHRALQEKECFAAIQVLMENQADPLIKDKFGWPASRLCIDDSKCSERVRKEFYKASGVFDEREFQLKADFPHRVVLEEENLFHGWEKNAQYVFYSPNQEGETNKVNIIMHYDDPECKTEKMGRCGFLVFQAKQAVHREPSYQTSILGYGANEPLTINLSKEMKNEKELLPSCQKPHVLMPYGKMESVAGRFELVVYSQEPLEIKKLVDWKHKVSANGRWTKETAGGTTESEDTFTNNPKYKLTVPGGREKFEVCILLSQARSMLDLNPFTVMTYEFFIGFYVFDKELFTNYFANRTWINAVDIWDVVSLDSRKESEFAVIPTTAKPGQCTEFTVTVLSDEPIELTELK